MKKIQSARFVRCYIHLTINRINHSNMPSFEVIGRIFIYKKESKKKKKSIFFFSRTDGRILIKSATKFNVLLAVPRDISVQ